MAPAALASQPSGAYGLPNSLQVDESADGRIASATPPSAAGAGSVHVALSRPLPPPAPRIFAITPERRALLNTIRYAEGTWANGADRGYWIMFGGGLMPSLDRHPDRVIRSARYASAAAGAYQFMPPTWAMVTRSLGLRTHGPEAFGPHVQDQAAIYLIRRRGALQLADQGVFSPELAHRLAPEWASFPTFAGRSFYGQPVKRYDDLRRFYEANLHQLRHQQHLRQQEALLASQAAAQPVEPCTPADSLRCRLEALDSVGPRSASPVPGRV
ncbi:MAG: endolysin [Cyanobacteria bacterium J06638_7]